MQLDQITDATMLTHQMLDATMLTHRWRMSQTEYRHRRTWTASGQNDPSKARPTTDEISAGVAR